MDKELVIGVPRELKDGERRVAFTPETVKKAKKKGFAVVIESGAGVAANFPDASYEAAGAQVVSDASKVWQQADLVFKINAPVDSEIESIREGQTLTSFIWPAQNKDLLDKLAAKKCNALAVDSVPRVSRAQKMDVLSTMANIAGYRAVIESANLFGRFFTGQITAAGKVPPARVLVIGAGVAGLAAIGAAKSLGAIVRAFDTRPVVKDQVKSMGAEFLELEFEEEGAGSGGYAKVMSPEFIKAEMELFAEQAKEVDIIVTTALIPGKPAPELITEDMVKSMKEGSIIVDLAAEQGGNCKLTEPGKTAVKHGVHLVGYTDLPSRLPAQSSQLFGNNMMNLLGEIIDEGKLKLDLEDDVIRGTTVVHEGEVIWPAPPPKVSAQDGAGASEPKPVEVVSSKIPEKKFNFVDIALVVMAIIFFLIGRSAPSEFINRFSVFVLAVVIGWQVVWSVTAALHTPLMSVTNAISGIIVIGAMVQIIQTDSWLATVISAVAVVIAAINIAGGFLVTKRMLKMFQK